MTSENVHFKVDRGLAGGARVSVLAALVILLLAAGLAGAGGWKRIQEDNLHDPSSPAVGMLQEPEEALKRLPADPSGNKVNWVRALEKGAIDPRSTRKGDKKIEIRDTEILMKETGLMPWVLFPHKPHTEWLACENCHDRLFEKEEGATQFTMLDILQGEYCGRCHSRVSFPLTECDRCHTVPKETSASANGAKPR